MSDFGANASIDDADLWRAGVVRDFAGSALFDRTFQQGMELVEQTAAYLDGPGRQESKQLNRKAALSYASESMRLTTRLMQVASWLLVQRAVRQGVRVVITHFVKQPGLRNFRWVRGENAVNICPDHQFLRIHHVGHDCTRKIGAVSAQRSDASIGSGADEAGDHGNYAGVE